jgi:hypothetical protein
MNRQDIIAALDLMDGETVEQILREIGMEHQMLRQLVLKADEASLTDLMAERRALGIDINADISSALQAQRESFAERHGVYPDTMTLGPTAWRTLREALPGACDGVMVHDMLIYEASDDLLNESYQTDTCIIGTYDTKANCYDIMDVVTI